MDEAARDTDEFFKCYSRRAEEGHMRWRTRGDKCKGRIGIGGGDRMSNLTSSTARKSLKWKNLGSCGINVQNSAFSSDVRWEVARIFAC